MVRHGKGWATLLFRTAVANTVMTAALVALQRPLSWWLESGISERIAWLATAILAGVAAYFLALFVLGVRTWELEPEGGVCRQPSRRRRQCPGKAHVHLST